MSGFAAAACDRATQVGEARPLALAPSACAGDPPVACPTSQPRSASGSATVAERPIVFRFGASVAQPREAERQEVAALVGDERVQLVEDHRVEVGEEARRRRCAERSSATCSGVVSRMSGGFERLALALVDAACRRCASRAGPARPISRDRRARGCARCRRRAPSAARCRACGCRARRPATVRPLVQRDEARQEAGERLAGAGRRDQQRRAPGARLLEQLELMRPRRPAARREPVGEDGGEGGSRLARGQALGGHPSEKPIPEPGGQAETARPPGGQTLFDIVQVAILGFRQEQQRHTKLIAAITIGYQRPE